MTVRLILEKNHHLKNERTQLISFETFPYRPAICLLQKKEQCVKLKTLVKPYSGFSKAISNVLIGAEIIKKYLKSVFNPG